AGGPEAPANLSMAAPEDGVALFVGPLNVDEADVGLERRERESLLPRERRLDLPELVVAEGAVGLRAGAIGDVVGGEHRAGGAVGQAKGAGHEHEGDGLVGVLLALELDGVHALRERGGTGAAEGGGDEAAGAAEEQQEERAHDANGHEVLL